MADNHTDLQERRQGDRPRARVRALVHGQVRRARGQLVPHPLQPLGRERHRVRRRRRPPDRPLPALPGGPARRHARADAAASRRTSTRTSATPGDRSRRRRSPGGSTTARARSASSGTARGCASRAGSRAPTPTRTSRSRRSSPPACTGSRTSLDLEDAYGGQRLRRRRQAAGAVEPRRRRSTCSRAQRSRGRRSGRRSSTTTCTTRARSSGRSRPRSPIGRSSAASNGCSHTGGRRATAKPRSSPSLRGGSR